MASPEPPLWTCPRCGHGFVTRNLWHSCGNWSPEHHFQRCDRVVRQTFEHFMEIVDGCGGATVEYQKTRIVFTVRVRFGGVVARRTWLEARLWLKRRAEHPLISKVESYGRLGWGHHFRFDRPEQLDDAFAALVREAYEIGCHGSRGAASPVDA